MYRFTFVLCLIVLVSCTSLALADIPKLINYQGMLTDVGGTPLNETVSITFKIYNDSLSESSGDKKWEETQTGVQVVNGLFNVMLGRVSSLNLDFSEDYWLDITVGAEHLSDRIRLTSVGYAYRAMVADTALVAVSVPTGGGWTDDGTVIRLETSTDSVGIGTTTPTEKLDVAGNVRVSGKATIGPGHTNTGGYSFVTGQSNTATGVHSAVGGGYGNTATGINSAVGGGSSNIAGGDWAAVGGGLSDTASGHYATVSGGRSNTASGFAATVPGGRYNTAGGWFSFAAGFRAKVGATDQGTFVWADSTNADFLSTGQDQFLIRATGGVGINTNDPGGFDLAVNGTAAKTGGGSWSVFSDIRLKQVRGACDYGLSEISKLKPVRYSYKEDNQLGLPTGQEYVGLVAQEVKEIIPHAVEENDQGYLMVNNDPIIWAMLNAIKELKAENDALKRRVAVLEGK